MKKNKSSEHQNSSKCFCVQDEHSFGKPAKKSSTTISAVSTQKLKLCGFFFLPQWCSPRVNGCFDKPSWFFPLKGLEHFTQSTRMMKTSEKLKKKSFFQNISSGHVKWIWTTALSLFWHMAYTLHSKSQKTIKKLDFLKVLLLKKQVHFRQVSRKTSARYFSLWVRDT